MKGKINQENKKGLKIGLWSQEDEVKNGLLHGLRIEHYKGVWFKMEFYKKGELFGEQLRNDEIINRALENCSDGRGWTNHQEFINFCTEELMMNFNEAFDFLK